MSVLLGLTLLPYFNLRSNKVMRLWFSARSYATEVFIEGKNVVWPEYRHAVLGIFQLAHMTTFYITKVISITL